jgi:hypothetical protein
MNQYQRNSLDIVFVLLILLPLVVISFFNQPIGDDYWFSALVRKHGFGQAYSIIRQTVSPRYTALSLMGINPLVFGNFFLYKIIPVVFIVIFFLTSVYLLKALTNQKLYLLSGIFTVTYLAVLPGIGEGLYWTSSLCVYQCGIVFAMLWVAALVQWYRLDKKKIATAALACFSLVATAGCNEILAGLTLIATSILLTKKRDVLSFVMLALSILCTFYLFSSSSFHERYPLSFHPTDILHSGYLGIQYTGYHMLKCVLNPFFWSGVILAPKIKLQFSFKKTIVPWLALLFLIEFIAAHVSSNHIVPLRITNMMIFFFLFGIFLLLPWRDIPYKYFLVSILLIAGMFTKNNISTATRELLNGDAAAYNHEMNDRYKLIGECKSDTCEIPQLQHRPVTLRYSSFDNDAHIGEYFNKVIHYK